VVVVDKPAGWTSHDVVARVRRILGTRRVGHAGTLDPMATGVLVVGVGRGTRLLGHLVGAGKTYEATIRLGQTTTTDDAEGTVTSCRDTTGLTEPDLRAALTAFTGTFAQVPPSVSAIKVDGRRAYARVRAGEEVTVAARQVTVTRFSLEGVRRGAAGPGRDAWPVLDVDVVVDCSSGTYVRALGRDVGERLGVGGHLVALRRTAVGPFRIDEARTLEQLAAEPAVLALGLAASRAFPRRVLTPQEVTSLRHGRPVGARGELSAPTAAFTPEGGLVALLVAGRPGEARPVVVFDPAGPPPGARPGRHDPTAGSAAR
jgi:tRNA pseudouridine55 synthase